MSPARDAPVTRAGRNLWRRCRAQRAAVIVDTAAYFEAFARACERARRSILVTGWDLDSRVRLRPEARPGGDPVELGPFLDALVRRRRGLEVHLLGWDFSLIYVFERELLPSLGWRSHRRVHFALDDDHPLLASQHQKVVVIDDAVAFAGGIDLCGSRWDTPRHAPDDPRRVGVLGQRYGPFHDVQMVVDGEAARALGDLVRERWRRATGRRVAPPPPTDVDPWPDSVAPDFEDVAVGVARTEPAYGGRPAVGEIRALNADAIAAARRWIYVENQYLTSRLVRDALAARLAEPDGPEVVLVAPRVASGWLEEATMSALRADIVRRLREADVHGRLLVCCPVLPGPSDGCLNVHAKVMIVDDRLLRVGSANLSNRSMGLDTECDLVIEARDAREREAVARVRWRLLGEHLGADPEALAASARELGALLAVIARHGRGARTLRPLAVDLDEAPADVLAHAPLVDPDGPLDGERVLDALVPPPQRARSQRALAVGVVVVLAALAIGSAWAFTPLRGLLDPAALSAAVAPLRASPWAPAGTVAMFVAGGLVGFPVTLLVLACAWVHGAWLGAAYSLAGVPASASVTYAVGRALGRGRVRRFAGARVGWLVERLRRRGTLSVALVRTFPVAPFSVVNVLSGAAHIPLGRFLAGTAIGMAPGIAAINLFGTSLAAATRRPDVAHALLALATGAALVAAGLLFRRWLRRREAPHPGPEPAGAPT